MCQACGRLLNRATGRCVCEDWGGNAPEPVAVAKPVAAAPVPTSPAPAPSPSPSFTPVAAAPVHAPPRTPAAAPLGGQPPVAVAQSTPPIVRPADDAGPPPRQYQSPPQPQRRSPAAVPAPVPAVPLPTASAAAPAASADPAVDAGLVGDAVVLKLKGAGRGVRHLVVARGQVALVRAKKVNPANAGRLSFAQLRTADPEMVVVGADQLLAVDVWQCPVGGRITLVRRNQSPIELRWTGTANSSTDVESALGSAFPGKVDQVAPDASAWVGYLVPRAVAVVLAVCLVFAGGTALGKALSGPPPVEEKPPPTTLAPSEVAVRAALSGACPAWSNLATLPRSAMPTQDAVLAAATAMAPGLVEASTLDSSLAKAEAELAWLRRWATLPAEEANRESLARVHYSMRFVTEACAPRG